MRFTRLASAVVVVVEIGGTGGGTRALAQFPIEGNTAEGVGPDDVVVLARRDIHLQVGSERVVRAGLPSLSHVIVVADADQRITVPTEDLQVGIETQTIVQRMTAGDLDRAREGGRVAIPISVGAAAAARTRIPRHGAIGIVHTADDLQGRGACIALGHACAGEKGDQEEGEE
ncbi:MAG: hypothetical protein IPP83_16675 [Flavobacteriales bacterium]|nr:hypothetical protein [Flavobacteriales bacterium]